VLTESHFILNGHNMSETTPFEAFSMVDMRAGRIMRVRLNTETRKHAYKKVFQRAWMPVQGF
jgi:hypothetical protein